jgi:PAS domain S-box-containing protein
MRECADRVPPDGGRRRLSAIHAALVTAAASLVFEGWSQLHAGAWRVPLQAMLVESLSLGFLTLTFLLLGLDAMRARSLVRGLQKDAAERQREVAELREASITAGATPTTGELPLLTFALDPHGRFERFNPRWLEMLGGSAAELMQRRFADLLPADQLAVWRDLESKVLAGSPVPRFQLSLLARGGRLVFVEGSAWPRKVPAEPGIAGSLVDVTPHRQAESAREQAEKSLRHLFLRNPAATYVSSADGRLLDCNDSFLRLLGFASREEALATPTYALYSITEDRQRLLAALRRNGTLDNIETKLRRRDGDIITVLQSIAWKRDAGGGEILEGIALDITPRLEAEGALRRSEARWRALLSLAPVGIAETTPSGDYVYVNAAWCQMSGLSPIEARGKGWLAAVDPDERERVAAEWAAAAAQGVRHPCEHGFLRRDGRQVWVAVDSAPLYNDRDVLIGHIRVVADVTGRKQAAEALRESEARFRNIFENGLGFVCIHDLEGRVLSVNPAAAGALGFTAEELCGVNLADLLAPAVRDGFAAYLEGLRQGRSADGLMRLLTRKGEERFWMYRNVLHTPAAGAPYVLGFAFDVTESRQARNALAASERRFRQFLEASGDLIQSVNAAGGLEYVNRRWQEVLGYTEAEARTLRLDGFVAPGEVAHCTALFERLQGGEELPLVETVFLAKDGREVHVEGTIGSSFENGAFVSCQGFFRDVSRGRMLEAQRRAYLDQIQRQNLELELHRQEAVRANRLKSEFLATMSHELRTPLNAIVGFSELLADDPAHPLSDKQGFHLGFVRQAAEHLLRLINDILDLSKIEAGRLKLAPETLRVAGLLAEVLSTLGPLAAQKRIGLGQRVPDDLTVFADRLHFKQILFNLLSNAIKFTPPEGTITVAGSREAGSLETGSGSCLLSISNTGSAVDPAEQEAIFDEFRQARGGAEAREGTGLGLAIVRRLVEQHEGKVWVESSPGTDIAFVVLLPDRPDRLAAAPLTPPVLPRAQRATGEPAILLVSDDEVACQRWSEALRRQRFSVRAVSCDDEALPLIRRSEPQLILLDLASSGARGARLLRELQPRERAAVRPLILALVADPASRRPAFLAGAHGCLVLPVTDGLLVDACRRRIEPFDAPRVVLIVEANPERQRLLTEATIAAGFRPVAVASGRDALQTAGHIHPHAVVLDLQLPGLDGYQMIVRLRSDPATANIPVLVLAEKGADAVETQVFSGPTRLIWLPEDDWRDFVTIEIQRTVGAERWLLPAAG